MGNQTSAFNQMCKFYGTKFLLSKFAQLEDALEFTRLEYRITPIETVQSGIRVYDPFWMKLLEARSGKKLPFNKDCAYFPFWGDIFPKGKRYYRFRTNMGPQPENASEWYLASWPKPKEDGAKV